MGIIQIKPGKILSKTPLKDSDLSKTEKEKMILGNFLAKTFSKITEEPKTFHYKKISR